MATPTPGAVPILPKPLFTLDTQRPKDFILVDGTPHELLRPDELSIVQHQRLMLMVPRYDALMATEVTLTDDESAELKGLLVRIVAIVLDAPGEIRARLNDSQLLTIVLAFTGLSRRLLLTPMRAETTAQQVPTAAAASARPSTGAKKSRASHASTRGRQRGRG